MQEEWPEHDQTEKQPIDGVRVVETPKRSRTDHVLRVVTFLVITALLIPVLGYLYTHLTRPQPAMPTEPQATTTVPVAETPTLSPVHVARYNVTATPPDGWSATPSPVETPTHVTEPLVTLTHPEAHCTIVYATLATEPFTEYYRQVGEGEDVMRSNYHVTRIEYRVASGTTVLEEGAEPHAEENAEPHATPATLAFAYHPLYYDNGTHDASRNAWIVFSTDDTLSEQCVRDFRLLTASLVREFPVRPLSRTDTGLLYLETHPEGTMLLFRNDTESTARVVARLDLGAVFKPTLHDGTITFIGTAGTLRSYTLFSESPATDIPLSLAQGASVNDFRIIGDSLYSLTGPWCRTGETPCALELVRYDRVDGSTVTLETEVGSPRLEAHSFEDVATVDTETAEILAAEPATVVHSLRVEGGSLSHGPELFEGSVAGRIPFVTYE